MAGSPLLLQLDVLLVLLSAQMLLDVRLLPCVEAGLAVLAEDGSVFQELEGELLVLVELGQPLLSGFFLTSWRRYSVLN